MIAVESLQNLDGNISIPTSQIIYLKNGKLLPSDNATFDSYVGIIYATYPAANSYMNIGLRLSLKTFKRAVEFGKTFIEIFNELI